MIYKHFLLFLYRFKMSAAVRRLGCIQRHLSPLPKQPLMVQQTMSGSTRASATNQEALQFLETIFSTPDLGVLALESKCRRFCEHYKSLPSGDKIPFLTTLSKQYGVNQDTVLQVARNVVNAQEKGEALLLMTEERLRHALIPQYQQLFSKIGRIEGGVKFLVDMRADILTNLPGVQSDDYKAHMRILQQTIRDLLALWFSVGFLHLQRITWQSPCDMVQKISDYEAVHPIRDVSDLKRRVGSYRRCFVFTHGSMPGEPVVVLHTALTSSISSSIHSILKTPTFSGSNPTATPDSTTDGDVDEKEDLARISAAIFYSITSTQKGLQGVDLGNYLIKTVVKELQNEFSGITQFSSLSPIPGFKVWLVTELNRIINLKDIGEDNDELLLSSEIETMRNALSIPDHSVLKTFKDLIQTHGWLQNEHICEVMKKPLMRLCARYLYIEKRRGFALNPVANFHLGNGAVLWRLNWKADMSMRGINQSCGMMVNYRYYLQNTEENSQKYLEDQVIPTTPDFRSLLEHTG
uniref:Malonyl-CoA decarboxylase, mitochondrial-like isoform X1 n=2 Tax=Crassostrea virginica TaxID=6565 RepID=A0A8B8ASQ3_CRAVI|nr:malonyl-CoA decarboxylase, mitochondrial-like isoform X1 [Crassostrea virginica]